MARGGINKAVVQKARAEVLAKGAYPSIDAVRVQLGNTGSKTTIAKYLKELETSAPSADASPKRLGDELSAVVEGLLEQVLQRGEAVVADAKALFDQERAALQAQLEELQANAALMQQQLATQQAALDAQTAELLTTNSSLQASLTRNAGLSQQCTDYEIRVADKDEQIRSLEEKHVHARGALEHYRDAVKEQREQDQRRHEAQIQQIQTELRQMQQMVSVKNDDLSRLNRDNERLLGESRQSSRVIANQEAKLQQLNGQVNALNIAAAKEEGAKGALMSQISLLRGEVAESTEIARAAEARFAETQERLAATSNELEMLRKHSLQTDE